MFDAALTPVESRCLCRSLLSELVLGRYFTYGKYRDTGCFRYSIPGLSILSVSIPAVRYCRYLLEMQSFRYLLTTNIPICPRNGSAASKNRQYRIDLARIKAPWYQRSSMIMWSWSCGWSLMVSVSSIESIESLCFGIDIVSVPSIGQSECICFSTQYGSPLDLLPNSLQPWICGTFTWSSVSWQKVSSSTFSTWSVLYWLLKVLEMTSFRTALLRDHFLIGVCCRTEFSSLNLTKIATNESLLSWNHAIIEVMSTIPYIGIVFSYMGYISLDPYHFLSVLKKF